MGGRSIRRLRGDPVGDERAKTVAALFKISELVIGGAGGRKQHHRLWGAARHRVLRGGGGGDIESSAALERRSVGQAPCKLFGRRADQIGLGDLAEQGPQRFDAALLRLAASDPEDVV